MFQPFSFSEENLKNLPMILMEKIYTSKEYLCIPGPNDEIIIDFEIALSNKVHDDFYTNRYLVLVFLFIFIIKILHLFS